MKHLLASLSIVALLALPGCCCKKKDTPAKQQTSMKQDKNMKKCDKDKDAKKKGCKSCKDDGKKKSTYSKQSYLELEAAEDLLI